jgi:hypothetical protein
LKPRRAIDLAAACEKPSKIAQGVLERALNHALAANTSARRIAWSPRHRQ